MGCSSSTALAGTAQPQAEFFDKYELGEVLGRGSYGTVHLVYSVKSHEKFAVKILDQQGGSKQSLWPMKRQVRKDVIAERKAWTHVGSHPNIVGLRESFIDGRFAYFLMELCTTSLLNAWMEEPDLNEHTYAQYFKQMAQALAHIHSMGVVHRDVKQDNFMVGAPDGRTVKLCDFGLSAVVESDGKLSGQYGTAPYMAPEMVTDAARYGSAVDVWSLGVIAYNAFFGCWPYQPRKHTADEMMKVIREGVCQPSFAPPTKVSRNLLSDSAIRFVKALLNRNPSRRPSAASCQAMPYFDKRRCNELQASKRMFSLLPQLHASAKCGAFNVRTPRADACQEWQLMKLQGTAQQKREYCSSTGDEMSRSTADTSTEEGTSPMSSQHCSSGTQGLDRPVWTEGAGRCIAL